MLSKRLIGTTIVVAAVALFAWFVWFPYRDVGANVAVETDAVPLHCSTGSVVPSRDPGSDEDQDEPIVLLVEAVPEMECSWRFFLVNNSGHDVVVERISTPFLEPGDGGPGFQAAHINPTYYSREAVVDGPPEDELRVDEFTGDVYWLVNDELLSGERTFYEIWLRFDETGCTPDGGSMWFDGQPQARIRFRGTQMTAESRTQPIGVSGTQHSSCDS